MGVLGVLNLGAGGSKVEGFQPEQRRVAAARYALGLEALDLRLDIHPQTQ